MWTTLWSSEFGSGLRGRVSLVRVTLGLLTALLMAGGCAGYRLGSTLPPDVRTIYVPTFENRTGEPLLEAETTAAVIDAFQQDGALRVVSSAAEADLWLTVVLFRYRLEPVRYNDDDRRRAEEYRLLIDARIDCRRPGSEEPLTSGRVQGDATFISTGSQAAAKRAALPDVSDDLAHDIVERVVEAW